MSVQGVNSQRPAFQPVQTQQTQQTGFAQPAQQKAQQNDPLAALTKALEALEQAVSALSSKGFNNNQSVAQSATQNLGQSGKSQQPAFDFSNLFGGGSVFDQPKTAPTPPAQQFTAPAQQFTAPVQQFTAPAQTNNDFLKGSGGGAAPVHGNSDHHIQEFGNQKSGGGGGIRVGSDGANNAW